MLKVVIHPLNIEISISANSILMDVLLSHNIFISNNCGSSGACKKCLVKLIQGNLSPDSKYGDYYLSCKAKILSDCVIEVVNFQKNNYINTEFFKYKKSKFAPIISTKAVNINENEKSKSDLTQFYDYFNNNYKIENIDVLKKLPIIIRDSNWNFNSLINERKLSLLDISKDKFQKVFGIAVDIGTTTVNMLLVDLLNGKIIDSESSYNKQISCGSDVISRIVYSEKNNGLQVLQDLIIANLNDLIDLMVDRNKIEHSSIYSLIPAGNTTMIHLLAGVTPKFVRLEPYTPAFSSIELKAEDLNLSINKNAYIYCPPNVGSYIGGDIIAGILATELCKDSRIKLFIDIGTNGEIVLGNDEWLMSAACSAGPAFEGAGVKCGMRAVEGAIDKLQINPDNLEPVFRTINDKKPVGICGSGMIDIIAELFDKKIIDRQGKFFKNKSERVISKENQYFYVVVDKNQSGNNKAIEISEPDIENIIRTKGAIFAGIMSLLNYVGITLAEIDEVIVAGGLGKNIDFTNAVKIGMLPDLPQEKYTYKGNTSLHGAYLILNNIDNFAEIEKICSIMNYFDISSDNDYMNLFVGALFLPHTDITLFPSFIK